MLSIYRRNWISNYKNVVDITSRLSSNASSSYKLKTKEKTDGNTTYVSMEKIEDPTGLRKESDLCSLCTCNVPVKVTYKDVLILEQFMRNDGTVLPRQLTGLCKKQQLRIERCVIQAFWSGLFGDKFGGADERTGYKRFNRYWKSDMSMYRLEKKEHPGTWYYIKRYPTKNQPLFKNPLQ